MKFNMKTQMQIAATQYAQKQNQPNAEIIIETEDGDMVRYAVYINFDNDDGQQAFERICKKK